MHGNDAARAYWVRQWSRVHTHDEPSEPIELDDGRIAVHIDQRIRMPDGSPVSTARFIHAHHATSPPWPAAGQPRGIGRRLDVGPLAAPPLASLDHLLPPRGMCPTSH
jgi:hypothetical protein